MSFETMEGQRRDTADAILTKFGASLQFSKEFTAFFEQRGKGIRIEAMQEVWGVTQSQTVQKIAARLRLVMPTSSRLERPIDHRAHKPMER